MDLYSNTIITETTRFFGKQEQAWELAKAIGAKPDYTVIDYGKTGDRFYVKYRKEA